MVNDNNKSNLNVPWEPTKTTKKKTNVDDGFFYGFFTVKYCFSSFVFFIVWLFREGPQMAFFLSCSLCVCVCLRHSILLICSYYSHLQIHSTYFPF